jgi:hypothetical protein
MRRPIKIGVILLAGLVLTAGNADAEVGSFNLDSLLVKSVGGPGAVERLASVETFYAHSAITLNDIPGESELYVALPDKIYYRVAIGPFEFAQAFDGHTAWTRDQNGMVSELSGFERATLMSMVYFQTYSYLFDDRLPGGKEYLGTEVRDNVPVHKVAFYPMDQDTVVGYFDTGTGYQRYETILMDNAEAATTYLNHRNYHGVMVATESRATLEGGLMVATMSIDSLAFDADFDRSIFLQPISLTDYRFPAGSDSVIVPFKMVAGHIYIEAGVNGRRLMFILDSGASTNMLNAPAFEGIDLPVAAEMAAKGIAGYENVTLVQTDSLEIGGMVLDQIVGTMPLDFISGQWIGDPPFGGVLGYDLLSRFPVLVDYQARELVFYDPSRFSHSGGGREVPFELTMQVPTIEAELNGITGRFLVDLGNSLGLIVHRAFSLRHNLEEVLDNVQETSTGVGGVGGSAAGKTAYVASFAFGDVRISDLRVLLPLDAGGLSGSGDLAGNIGNLVLQQFRVLFDYRNRRLVFFGTSDGSR